MVPVSSSVIENVHWSTSNGYVSGSGPVVPISKHVMENKHIMSCLKAKSHMTQKIMYKLFSVHSCGASKQQCGASKYHVVPISKYGLVVPVSSDRIAFLVWCLETELHLV